MIEHLIETCVAVPGMKEILLIGFYQQDEMMNEFIQSMLTKHRVAIRYLQEYAPLGTAGGIHHFRDQLCLGSPEAILLLNGDVCGNFDLKAMLDFDRSLPTDRLITILATEATRQQSLEYGCIVEDKKTHQVLHYVEKPSSFVSSTINCGVYLFSPELLPILSEVFRQKHELNLQNSYQSLAGNEEEEVFLQKQLHSSDSISLEYDLLKSLLDSRRMYVWKAPETFWFCPIKTPSSAIYANRNYLALYRTRSPQLLAGNSESGKSKGPKIIGDVFIHPTAVIDPTATVRLQLPIKIFVLTSSLFSTKIGPNVSISEGVHIGAGVRLKESIILKNVNIKNHSLVMYSIIGWCCTIGCWSRVEGTPCDPNPDRAFAKIDNHNLFDGDGKLNPLITVLGKYSIVVIDVPFD